MESRMDATEGQGSPTDIHCYDIRTPDLGQLFATFGRRPMPDWAIWSLSLAQSCQPEGSIGFEVWITRVAGTDIHRDRMIGWAQGLAETLATVKPMLNKRRRAMFETYGKAWADQAAMDGIQLALAGNYPPTATQAERFGACRKAYARMRNLIAGFAMLQCGQYEDALGWAVRQNSRYDLS